MFQGDTRYRASDGYHDEPLDSTKYGLESKKVIQERDSRLEEVILQCEKAAKELDERMTATA